jgi:NADH-quinone oxidoreductase subunit N
MVALGLLLLLLDLVVRRKGFLGVLALLGLGAPLGFSIALWLGMDGSLPDLIAEPHNNGILASTLAVDRFSLFFKFLFIGVAAVVVLISMDYARRLRGLQAEYYALLLLATSGMMLLASSVELITLYIALELTALPIAALAAFLKDGRSSESGLKFLILAGVSSALLLYGMVLVYGFTGTTVLAEISERIVEIGLDGDVPFGSYALLLGIVLIVAGFGFKLTAFPFQMWAPDVYEGAPTPVTAFLSVASKSAGFAVVLRVFYIAFPLETLNVEWSAIFAILAALSMTVGNLVAIPQNNIKRMLAYSTISHAGYLMVGLAAVASRTTADNGDMGPSGVLFYLGGYAVMNLAAFSVVIAVSNRTGSDQIGDFAGLSRTAPYLAAVLAFALVSLTGVPPTVGFMAKVYIFGAAVDSGLAWLAVVGVVNSVISAYYYLRVVKVMYLSDPPGEERLDSGMPIRLAMLATVAGVLVFGIYPGPLIELAKTAAAALP